MSRRCVEKLLGALATAGSVSGEEHLCVVVLVLR